MEKNLQSLKQQLRTFPHFMEKGRREIARLDYVPRLKMESKILIHWVGQLDKFDLARA